MEIIKIFTREDGVSEEIREIDQIEPYCVSEIWV